MNQHFLEMGVILNLLFTVFAALLMNDQVPSTIVFCIILPKYQTVCLPTYFFSKLAVTESLPTVPSI